MEVKKEMKGERKNTDTQGGADSWLWERETDHQLS